MKSMKPHRKKPAKRANRWNRVRPYTIIITQATANTATATWIWEAITVTASNARIRASRLLVKIFFKLCGVLEEMSPRISRYPSPRN